MAVVIVGLGAHVALTQGQTRLAVLKVSSNWPRFMANLKDFNSS
jgi:hypothetical protein